jgi:hypothetical protein
MRWLLLALCACNRILGLDDVGIRDARVDGPSDAQPYCPTMTGVVPRFSTILRQVIDQDCNGYQTSATVAVASCAYPVGTAISQGQIDQPLEPIPGLPALPTAHVYLDQRISPEGDILYLDEIDIDTFTATYRSFIRQSDASWSPGPDLPIAEYGIPSVPSRGPQRHLLFYSSSLIEEWVQDTATTWHALPTFDLGQPIQAVWLAPDGLRAAIVVSLPNSDREVRYVDRASIDDPFAAPQPLSTLPAGFDVFITADCTRAYMSGAYSVFYATQI